MLPHQPNLLHRIEQPGNTRRAQAHLRGQIYPTHLLIRRSVQLTKHQVLCQANTVNGQCTTHAFLNFAVKLDQTHHQLAVIDSSHINFLAYYLSEQIYMRMFELSNI